MKLNLSTVPRFAEIWEGQYVRSDLSRAALLSSQFYTYLNIEETEQRNRNIRSLVLTAAVRDLLVTKTLVLEVFCALVVEYIVEAVSQSSVEECFGDSKGNNFPVPYRVIEPVVKNLIGEEKPEELEEQILRDDVS